MESSTAYLKSCARSRGCARAVLGAFGFARCWSGQMTSRAHGVSSLELRARAYGDSSRMEKVSGKLENRVGVSTKTAR